MITALQVGKAIEILSKYENIIIHSDYNKIYLGVYSDDIISLEDENALKELDFQENYHNYWYKYI